MSRLAKAIAGSAAVALVLGGAMLVAGHELDAHDRGGAAVQTTSAASQSDPLVIDYAPGRDGAPQSQAMPATAGDAAGAVDNDPFIIKRILPINGPIKYGEWHWDTAGVPQGPLVITVDLQARVVSVFRDGYEIGTAAAMIGSQAHPTPTGIFPILTKERHNISEKYDDAPMPWTLRLTWDGVAIHGGAEVQRGYASHGCVGVPDAFVSKLYGIAKVGDKVIITNGVRAGLGTPLAS